MRGSRGLGAVGVLATIVLTGCGGGGDAPAAPRSSTSSSSSTSTVPKRSIAEVASVVAQQRARIEKLQADLADCPSVNDMQQLSCTFVVRRVNAEGGITLKALKEMQGPRMPDEVAGLFEETYAAANELTTVDETPCEDGKLSAECSASTYAAQRATEDLLAKFDGWAPYL